ncbi:Glyoxylase I 4 [Ranunculus cassubicifolius]
MGILQHVQEEENVNIPTKTPCLPLLSLNHVSFVCKSVIESADFYQQVLGFVLIRRPSSFKFEGAWLFNYGIGIHLLQSTSISADGERKPKAINPKDDHISFQCTDIELVKSRLREMGMKYVSAIVEEGGIQVDQLFFHDPDGHMIEICNCENLPVLPLATACHLKKPKSYLEYTKTKNQSFFQGSKHHRDMETRMMDNLVTNLINLTM